jgi:hypothetical protein
MTRRRCHTWKIAGLLVLTGCFELTAVETTPRESRVYVSLHTSPDNQVELVLWIDPGTDPSGAATPLVSDSILVAGDMYGADETSPNGERRYLVQEIGTPGIPLEIHVPGTVSAPIVPKLTLTPLGLIASDTLVAVRGDIAHVELIGFGDSIPGQTVNWSWIVIAGEQSVLSVSGRVLPEGRFAIPTSLFPPEATEGVLRLDGRVSSAIALGPYSAALSRTFLALIPFRLNTAAPE